MATGGTIKGGSLRHGQILEPAEESPTIKGGSLRHGQILGDVSPGVLRAQAASRFNNKYKNSSYDEMQSAAQQLEMEKFGLEQYGGTFQKNDELQWLKVNSQVKALEEWRDSFKTPEAFEDAVYNTYMEAANKNLSFDEMQEKISALQKQKSSYAARGELDAYEKELAWLQEYMYTKPYTTQADYKAAIASANKYLQEEEDLKEKAYNIVRGKAMGWYDNGKSPKDYEREAEDKKEFYEEKKKQIGAMESALELLAFQDYYVPITPEFQANAAYRDYNNPTREELWAYDEEQANIATYISNGAHFGEDGNIYNRKGDLIIKVRERPVIEDKLGLFLSTTPEDRREATREKAAANQGSYTNTWANAIYEGLEFSWSYLTDREIDIYYDLYKREGQEAAYQFLTDMETELNRRETEEMEKKLEQATPIEKVIHSALSIPATAIGNILSPIDILKRMAQGKEINPYSAAQTPMNYSEMVRTYTANDINTATGNAALPWVGTTFGDVYQFLMSAGDTAFGVGLFGPAVYSVLMGMGAAASTAKDLWERGASTEQMAVGGVLAGAAEYFFEKFSIDKLIHMKDADTIGGLFLNTLKQGGIEFSEESATQAANIISDAIVMGSKSNWQAYTDKYMAEGDSQGEAMWKALYRDVAPEVINAGIGGFISGSSLGGAVSAANYAGNKIRNNGQTNNTSIPQNGIDGNVRSGYTDAIGGGQNGGEELLYNRGGQAGEQNADTQGRVGAVQEAAGGMESDLSTRGVETGVLGDRGDSGRVTVSAEQIERLKTTAVKNADGTPKPVYHFTGNMEFDTFAEGDTGFHFGSEAQAAQRGQDLNQSGRMIEAYLDIQNPVRIDMDIMNWNPDTLALKLYGDGIISQEEMHNVFGLARESGVGYNAPAAVELRRILAEKGYDGVVYQNGFEGEGESYIAFYPEQIITLDDGRGTGGGTGNAVRTARRSIDADIISEERVGQARGDTQYTEAQYNDFGWARANGVLSDTAFRLLTEKIAEIKTGTQFARTRYGDYIIPVGDESGIYNILVYTDGNMESPHIRKIIEINAEDRVLLGKIRKGIFAYEKNNESRGVYSTEQYVRDVFGEEYIQQYTRADWPSFRRYAGEGQRGAGRAGDRADGTGIDRGTDATGAGAGRQVNRQTQADSDGSAFLVPENDAAPQDTRSVFTEPDIRKSRDYIKADFDRINGLESLTDAQREVKRIGRDLGRTVVFEDTLRTQGFRSNGYIDSDGVIHIDYTAADPVRFIFKHELTHFAEGTKAYERFVEAVESSRAFREWLSDKTGMQGESVTRMKAAYRQTVIESRRDKAPISVGEAQAEMIADFAGDTLFAADSDLQRLVASVQGKRRNAFVRYIQDFIAYMKEKLAKRRGVTREIVQLERRFSEAVAAVTEESPAADNGRVKKYSIREKFAEEIDAWDGKSKETFRVGRTSEVLKSIGVKDRDIIWHGGKINKILQKHSAMTREVIKQVPQILENPVLVLKSKSSDSRIVIFGEVTDANGNLVTAILELQPTAGNGRLMDMNIIASAYGKEGNLADFILGSNLIYIDKNTNRAKNWLQSVGLQLPADTTVFDSIGSITYPDGKVKIKSTPANQYMQKGKNNTKQENSVHKQRQLNIINANNSALDSYHTWIRTIDDIKTFEEAINDPEWNTYDVYNPDYSRSMAEDALQNGTITVYSSYPIGPGVFVSPSRMEAESYSSDGHVYKKTVKLSDIAWIDPTQGQYAIENDTSKQKGNKYSIPAEAQDLLDRYDKGEISRDAYHAELARLWHILEAGGNRSTVLEDHAGRRTDHQAQKDVSGLDKQSRMEDNGRENTADEAFDIFEQGDIITDGSHMEGGKLKPNVRYQTGEFAYIYETNADGLIEYVFVQVLHLKKHIGRLRHQSNTYGKKAGDQAGHLIGDRFGGSPALDNLVSQAQKVNQKEFKKIENQWAKALKNGKQVSVIIKMQYEAGNTRPSSFTVSYKIDGETYSQFIKN